MEKITKREMYEAISNYVYGEVDAERMSVEDWEEAIVNFCKKEIESLDKKREKAKEYVKEKEDPIMDFVETAVVAMAGNEDKFYSRDEVTAFITKEYVIEGIDVTPAKVQYRLNELVKRGVMEKAPTTIPGPTEAQKTRKVQGYRYKLEG